MVDDDSSARPHVVGWETLISHWRPARVFRRGSDMPGPTEWRRTRCATAVRSDLWSHCSANARAACWRSAEASVGRASNRPGALVSAEVLLRDGGSLAGARVRGCVPEPVHSTRRDSGGRDFQRQPAAGADRRSPDAGRAFGERPPRDCGTQRALGAVRRAGARRRPRQGTR